MRNKESFINDAYAVIKEEYKTDLNVVEDAAHVMNHTQETKYTLPGQFTISGQEEVFNFEIKKRPMTDNPDKEIEDFYYTGKGDE